MKNKLKLFVLAAAALMVVALSSSSVFAQKDVSPTRLPVIDVTQVSRLPVYNMESLERYMTKSVSRIRGNLSSSGMVWYEEQRTWFEVPYVKPANGSSIADMFKVLTSQRFDYQMIDYANDQVWRYSSFANVDGYVLWYNWYSFVHVPTKGGWDVPEGYDHIKMWKASDIPFNFGAANWVSYRYKDADGREQQGSASRNQNGVTYIPTEVFEYGMIKDMTFSVWDGQYQSAYVFDADGYSVNLVRNSIRSGSSGSLPHIHTIDLSTVPAGNAFWLTISPDKEDIAAGRWPQYQVSITNPSVALFVRGGVSDGYSEQATHIWITHENDEDGAPHPVAPGQFAAIDVGEKTGTYWVRLASPNLGEQPLSK